jgi:outer membrane protein assembly factor BamB
MRGDWTKVAPLLPPLAVVAAAVTLGWWWTSRTDEGLVERVPGRDAAPGGESGAANPVLAGQVIRGEAQPMELPGDWPQFRGPNRDGIASEPGRVTRDWQSAPPRPLWSVELGEGYAGPAVRRGRVYVWDYDYAARQSALRCLSLADGRDVWRFAYPHFIKRNHGMTRTVPAVTDAFVVGVDSKCNVLCLDAASGALRWTLSLVGNFGATVPDWYTGQCPLVEDGKVILAPAGRDALLIAVDAATGKVLWRTPNPRGWRMTHSSIMPMELSGRRVYVYCASGGVVGVDANDGTMLFESSDWKISIATVPSPLPLPDGRIFFTGGYNAGSLMAQLESANGRFAFKSLFRLPPTVFGATQHTPIYRDGHLYGVRADGRFVCLGLDGKVVWASGAAETFGLGSFLMADDVIFALNDNGRLSLIAATPTRWQLLGQTQILQGRESWAPMALVGNRLLARDLTRLVCLDVAAR